jgi:hypothetical protein
MDAASVSPNARKVVAYSSLTPKECKKIVARMIRAAKNQPPGIIVADLDLSCIYRGTEDQEPALILCESCQGRVRIKYPVRACEIHNFCLPTFQGAPQSGFKQCHGCEDRIATPLSG